MRTPTGGHLQQTTALQKHLRPGVAPPKRMIAYQVLVKVPGREPSISPAIQSLHRNRRVGRNPVRRRLTQPTIRQTSLAALVVATAPTAKCPLANPKQFSRLDLA